MENKDFLQQVDVQVDKKKTTRNIIIAAVVAIVVIAAGIFVAQKMQKPDVSAYADVPITVTGLQTESFTIYASDLLSLDCVNGAYTGQGKGSNGESKAENVAVYGPTMETFLAKYGDGTKQAEYGRIIVKCSDGYEVVYRGDALDGEIIMSVGEGTSALSEDSQPLRFVVPSLATGKWARGVVSIAFEK